MDIVLYNPESPDMEICESDYPESENADMNEPVEEFSSSPPYYVNDDGAPTTILKGKESIDTSSDPLTGPSPLNKRAVTHITEISPTSQNLPNKRHQKDPFIQSEDDDNSSEIIANAPRLNSSIHAQPTNHHKIQTDYTNLPFPHTVNEDKSIPKCAHTEGVSVKEELFAARDHIVRAYNSSRDRNEQSRLLDLLEIFREYAEKGRLYKASTIIASQVANLETATRQIETKARDLKKIIPPAVPDVSTYKKQQNHQEHQQQKQHQQQQEQQLPKVTMASIASRGVEQSARPQEWTVVGKKSNSGQARNTHSSQPKPKAIRRVILVQDPTKTYNMSPLEVRNRINHAFATHSVKGPVVNLVARTNTKNIAINTTEEYTADFLLEKKEVWEHLIPHISAQKDQPWFKVVAHGIPLADFNHESGMEMIKEEVETFNKGLHPIGMPYWISTKDNRMVKNAGSVAIAFATEQEANRAIQNRLFIAGISVRVSKFYSVAATTQCQNCQGFGHLDSYCRRLPICALCGDKHSTQQHLCSVCKTKGKTCTHLEFKCANCGGNHQASSKTCEIYLALKNTAPEEVL